MQKPVLFLYFAACVLSGALVRAQTTAPAPVTPEMIQKMIDAQGYRPALRAISQIMPSGNAAPPGVDKYGLLMMRGECLVQLKDKATALIAYDQAATTAANLAQNEAARAMTLLINNSPGMVYTPRTGEDRKPLDITDMAARKRAMVALLADQLPAVAARANAVVGAATLTPAMAGLRDLHALEQTATGDDKQTLAIVRPLADKVYSIIDGELTQADAQVQAIQRSTARNINYGGGSFQNGPNGTIWVPDQGSSGLTNDNRQALRDANVYLSNIGQTCDDLAAVARRYDRDGQRWQALGKRTQGIIDMARAVYDHE